VAVIGLTDIEPVVPGRSKGKLREAAEPE